MDLVQPNDFQRGDDFIALGAFSPPPPSTTEAEAGPSRSRLSKDDQALLDTRNGRKDAASTASTGTGRGGETYKKRNGWGKRKGGDKEKGGDPGASEGKKRAKGKHGEPVGPKNLKEERKAAERLAPWTDMVDWEANRDPAEMLNAEIDAFYQFISPTRAEYEVRLFMIELITRAILRSWPDAEVTPFGSWQTQLYLPQGDIDLVVSTKRLTEANKGRLLAELARAMRLAHITDVVAIISRARVPIIKFVTTEGKLNVDISLNQVNGISAGQIINQYLDVLPGCRQLILVVKAFLSQRSMNEVYTGGLGSYAVICLVISFLQHHPKLRRADIDPEENLGTLLIEFFELYGRNFHYDEVGISIRRGGSYYKKKNRGWYKLAQPFLLSIEDPQDPDNDISGGSYGIRQVKNTLAGAYEMLQTRLFERAEHISGRRSGRYDAVEAEEMSILTGVMGITKDTQKHRKNLQLLHQEGRLQRMLSIPPKARPEEYVQNFRPPPIVGVKRRNGQIRLDGGGMPRRRGNDNIQGEARPSGSKGGNGVARNSALAAVMLDDDDDEGGDGSDGEEEDSDDAEMVEDEDEDDDEEEEVEDQIRIDGAKRAKIDPAGTRTTGTRRRSNTEDGEIIEISSDEVVPAANRQGKLNRSNKAEGYESVSHDSDEYEVELADAHRSTTREGSNASDNIIDNDDDGVETSRYAAVAATRGEKRKLRKLRKMQEKRERISKNAQGGSRSGSESDAGSSGSSVILLSRPDNTAKGMTSKSVVGEEDRSLSTTLNAGNEQDQAQTKEASASANGSSNADKGSGSIAGSGTGIRIKGAGAAGGAVGRREKRNFWAAKGQKVGDRDDDEDDGGRVDEFAGGADFVGL